MKRVFSVILCVALTAFTAGAFACGNKIADRDVASTEAVGAYTITYDLKGGRFENSAVTSYDLSDKPLSLPTPVRSKYKFVGWTDGGEPFLYLAAGTSGDKTLVAVWERAFFTVTFYNASEAEFTAWADGTDGNKTLEVETGKTIVFPKTVYDMMSVTERSYEEYVFDGWYFTDKSGEERKIEPSTVFTLENLNADSYDLELKAKVFYAYSGFY